MARLLLALTFALALFVPATEATDQRILGKKLIIKNPRTGVAVNKMVHLGKDPSIAISPSGSAGDPTCSGAGGGGASSLAVITSGGGGDVYIPLPCNRWTTNATNTLYKYTDTSNATCTLVVVRDGALAKAICRGSQVAIDLNASMSPVAVITTLNNDVFCTEFGGTVVKDGSDEKTFMRKDALAPAVCTLSPRKLVFVTSAAYDGNLGGLSGADAKCNAAAASAGLPGTYKAWLSDSTASPSTRFTQSAVLPYRRVDGTLVARNWADLTDLILAAPINALAAPINVTESGSTLGTNQYAWTYTTFRGSEVVDLGPIFLGGLHCADWTSNARGEYGIVGDPADDIDDGTLGGWSVFDVAVCDATGVHLFCFQQ